MLALRGKTRGLIGVDTGAGCVKVAQLVRKTGHLVLTSAAIFEREHTSTGEAAAPSPFALHDIGENLRACDEFFGPVSAAVLSMSACEIKSEPFDAHLPWADIDRLAAGIAARDSHLTGPLQYDCWTSRDEGRNESLLHVVSTSQRTASELEQQHRRTGWSCAAVDALPTALARAIQLGGYNSAEPLAAIDWGWSRVTLCIVLRGEAVFVRSFARGALVSLVNPLRRKLNLTKREARTLLADVGVGTIGAADKRNRTQAMVAECTAAGLGEFQTELSRTLSFLRGRHRTFNPRGMVLFGGGAMVGNIAPYVSQQFELDAQVWNYPYVEADATQSQLVPLPLLGPAVALSALAWGSP